MGGSGHGRLTGIGGISLCSPRIGSRVFVRYCSTPLLSESETLAHVTINSPLDSYRSIRFEMRWWLMRPAISPWPMYTTLGARPPYQMMYTPLVLMFSVSTVLSEHQTRCLSLMHCAQYTCRGAIITPGLLNAVASAASPLSLTVRDSRRLVLEIGFGVNHFPWV